MVKETRLYDILGVQHDVDDATLKKRYRILVKKFHPDKNPEGGETFKDISMAYDILSDPEKRNVYDLSGEEGIKGGRSADETEVYSESDDDEVSGLSSDGDDDEEHEYAQNTSFFGHSQTSYTSSGSFRFSSSSFEFSHGFQESFESDSESESDIDSDEDSRGYFEQNSRNSGNDRSTGKFASRSEDEDDSYHGSDDDIISDNDSIGSRGKHQSKYKNVNSKRNARHSDRNFMSDGDYSESEEELESGKYSSNHFTEVHDESDDDDGSESPEVVNSESEEESYFHEQEQSFNHHYENSEPDFHERERFNNYDGSDGESEPNEYHRKFSGHEDPDMDSEPEVTPWVCGEWLLLAGLKRQFRALLRSNL